MVLYTRGNEKIEFDSNDIIGGNTTTIYKTDKGIIKVLDDTMWMSIGLFNVLKSVNNSHFIKMNEFYKKHFLYHSVDAYSVDFIKSIDASKILYDSDYFLDNINEIDKLIDLLTEEHILMCDFRSYNLMFSENEIIVIDPDFYLRFPYKKTVHFFNKKMFINVIKDIVSEQLAMIDANSNNLDLELKYDENIPLQLSKKLNKKRIIDKVY